MSFPTKTKSKRFVYLDHAATTPTDSVVVNAMRPYLTEKFANPSALYSSAVQIRNDIEHARKSIADILFTQPDTILFTGSGTESTNLAILGIAKSYKLKAISSGHIITTTIEHHSVLNPIKQLEKEGWAVTYLPVNQEGSISIEDFKKALRPETVLVSIMYANNEIGTILPIAEIGREILKWRKSRGTVYPYFHTDACQAGAFLDLHVERLHVDFMSLNGSKIYGPKGIGMLYKRRGVEIEPIMYGGGQEFHLRSGTENVAGIIGLAKALEIVTKYRNKEIRKLRNLRDYFWKEIQEKIPDVTLNGPFVDFSPFEGELEGVFGANKLRTKKKYVETNALHVKGPHLTSPDRGGTITRLPNNLNVTFKDVDAEALILYLDEYGIICSSGSACTTDSDEVSHILLACGMSENDARSSIRFTLGKMTTKKDIDYVMKYLSQIVKELRVRK